jgi:hypothetical protein
LLAFITVALVLKEGNTTSLIDQVIDAINLRRRKPFIDANSTFY